MHRDISSTPGLEHQGACVHAGGVGPRMAKEGSTEEVGSALGTDGGQPGRRRGGAPGSSGARNTQETP